MKTYIIGDVHGCYLTLRALIDKLEKDSKIIFVGDLIDRGPRSKEVVQFVKENNFDCVLGNHELFMIKDYEIIKPYVIGEEKLLWGINGGYETLESYDNKNENMKEDVEWMKTLPLYKEYPEIKDKKGRYLVVSHSNLTSYFHRYKLLKKDETNLYNKERIEVLEDRMLWDRSFGKVENNDFFNVFGHTITYTGSKMFGVETKNKIIIDEETGYADIDTGCFYKRNSETGILTALEFPTLKVIQQINID